MVLDVTISSDIPIFLPSHTTKSSNSTNVNAVHRALPHFFFFTLMARWREMAANTVYMHKCTYCRTLYTVQSKPKNKH